MEILHIVFMDKLEFSKENYKCSVYKNKMTKLGFKESQIYLLNSGDIAHSQWFIAEDFYSVVSAHFTLKPARLC